METDKTVELDGKKFLIQRFQAEESTELFFELCTVVGESLLQFIISGSFASENPESDDPEKAGIENMMKALRSFNGSADSASKLKLMKRILSKSRIFESDSKAVPIVFNQVFNGSLLTAFKLVREVLQFEYASFLAGSLTAKSQ